MRKVLVLVAILAGLNAFGASCSSYDDLQKLEARANEYVILYKQLGGDVDDELLNSNWDKYLSNRYAILNDECFAMHIKADLRFTCFKVRLEYKYIEEFEAKGLEVNLKNIDSEGKKAYDEVSRCKKILRGAK